MFDLPTLTDKDRKIYAKFRNFLLDDGYIMIQYSIYSRICKNDDDLCKHVNRVKHKVPKIGNVRLLTVTESQYNKMVVFYGEKKKEENITTESLIVI